MSPKYFVEIVRQVVQQQAVKDIFENLENPPGRNPSERSLRLNSFFKTLTAEDQIELKEILKEATEMTLFGLLCVLDGVRTIESGEDKGTLELWYRKGEETIFAQ